MSTTSASCPSCGNHLDAGARFCSACGRPTGTDPGGERRLVTVVFADLAGFTNLAEGRDPESVKAMLDRCFGVLVPVVEAHGGSVDKIIGDELMAVFGAPIVHEDDPHRAVRAALALAHELGAWAPELVLRIGVNTGEVLSGPVGPGLASTVTGDTVNTAHRLASVARPGEILVGERTRAATRRHIRYEARDPYQLRGKQEPVSAWAALGAGTGSAPTPTPGRHALVGRRAELGRLRSLLARTFGDRQPMVGVVTGEPGLGKTRLGRELVADPVATQAMVLWTACAAYGVANTLEPLADLVRGALAVSPTEPAEVQAETLRRAVADLGAPDSGERSVLLERLTQLLGIARPRDDDPLADPVGTRSPAPLVAAAHGVLAALARDRPVIVVIDDLQWADGAVLGFLDHLPARVPDRAVFGLGLGRDEVLERGIDLDRRPGRVPTMGLEPLRGHDAEHLVRVLLADADPIAGDRRRSAEPDPPAKPASELGPPPGVGPELETRLIDASGGNPLLADQLVSYLVESSSVGVVDGMWRASGNLDELALPDEVRSLIGARLDTLATPQRRALAHAAVVGRRFWTEAVAALGTGDADERLSELSARGLVEPVTGVPRPGDWVFCHSLTRDVAYAGLAVTERARLHTRVAGWLRERFPGAAMGTMSADLAHHYERAVALGREVDQSTPGLAGTAFEAMVAAGRDAERREALREAERWYRRARELGTAEASADLSAGLSHGVVLVDLQRIEEADAVFAGVLSSARPGTDDDPTARQATAWLAVARRIQGDTESARALFDEALEACRDAGDDLAQADTLRLEGWSELTAGRARAAEPRLWRAWEIERAASSDSRPATLQTLGFAEFLNGDLANGRAHLWQACGRYAAEGDRGGTAWCFGLLCFTFLLTGQLEHAASVATNLAEEARTQSDPAVEAITLVLLAACRVYAGEPERASPLITDAMASFDERDDAWGRVMARLVAANAARMTGRLGEARTLLLEGLATPRPVRYVAEDARLLVELASVELDRDDPAEAARRARSALARVRGGLGDHETGGRALLVLAEVARRDGELAEAQLLAEEARDPGSPDPPTDTWRVATALVAEVSAAQGHPDRAEAALARLAGTRSEAVRVAVATARAHAAVALARGRPTEAAGIVATLEQEPRWAWLPAVLGLRAELGIGP